MNNNNNKKFIKLPPEINRFIYVKNLPFKITPEELYDIFGKFGVVRQIRKGMTNRTRGTAFVVYEDILMRKKLLINCLELMLVENICYVCIIIREKNKCGIN